MLFADVGAGRLESGDGIGGFGKRVNRGSRVKISRSRRIYAPTLVSIRTFEEWTDGIEDARLNPLKSGSRLEQYLLELLELGMMS